MYRKKILLIDDDPHILEILEKRLEKSGYFCLRAMEGIKALKLIEEEHPDIIILDILLPGELDGYTLCKQLKTDIRYQKIPIIFLSALDEEYHIQEGLKRGADAYITKPFHPDDLIAKIEELKKKKNPIWIKINNLSNRAPIGSFVKIFSPLFRMQILG